MKKQKLANLILLVIFGVIMFISKMIMEFLPNIHAVAMFIAVFTLAYRHKALISIYVYVFLIGFIYGFNAWWYPYIYIWTVLWVLIMLIPKKLPMRFKVILSWVFCALHGLAYGTLYAPVQAAVFGLSFEAMISWIIAGLPWDIIHMVGNIAMGTLIYPLYRVLLKLMDKNNTENQASLQNKKLTKNNVFLECITPSGQSDKRYYLKNKK